MWITSNSNSNSKTPKLLTIFRLDFLMTRALSWNCFRAFTWLFYIFKRLLAKLTRAIFNAWWLIRHVCPCTYQFWNCPWKDILVTWRGSLPAFIDVWTSIICITDEMENIRVIYQHFIGHCRISLSENKQRNLDQTPHFVKSFTVYIIHY